jgi:hypothetical protein
MRRRTTKPEQTGEKHDVGAAPAPLVDPIEQIKDLDELRGQGILTEEEFTAEKKRLLGI